MIAIIATDHKDQVWQAYRDWVQERTAQKAEYISRLLSWNVDLDNPYAPIDPTLRAFVRIHGFGAAYRIIGDVVTENEGR